MKIRSISVKGLFHNFDHEIRFNDSGIAIIIGENGIGKTTLLQIINSICPEGTPQFVICNCEL